MLVTRSCFSTSFSVALPEKGLVKNSNKIAPSYLAELYHWGAAVSFPFPLPYVLPTVFPYVPSCGINARVNLLWYQCQKRERYGQITQTCGNQVTESMIVSHPNVSLAVLYQLHHSPKAICPTPSHSVSEASLNIPSTNSEKDLRDLPLMIMLENKSVT